MPATDCIIIKQSFEERRYHLLSLIPTLEDNIMQLCLFARAFNQLLLDVHAGGIKYKTLYAILFEEFYSMNLSVFL